MAGVLVHCMVLDIALQLCTLASFKRNGTEILCGTDRNTCYISAASPPDLHLGRTYDIYVLLGSCSLHMCVLSPQLPWVPRGITALARVRLPIIG